MELANRILFVEAAGVRADPFGRSRFFVVVKKSCAIAERVYAAQLLLRRCVDRYHAEAGGRSVTPPRAEVCL